jgi:hypothetical protein
MAAALLVELLVADIEMEPNGAVIASGLCKPKLELDDCELFATSSPDTLELDDCEALGLL